MGSGSGFVDKRNNIMGLREVSKEIILPTGFCTSWAVLYLLSGLLFKKKLKQQDVLNVSTMNRNLCYNSSTLFLDYLLAT